MSSAPLLPNLVSHTLEAFSIHNIAHILTRWIGLSKITKSNNIMSLRATPQTWTTCPKCHSTWWHDHANDAESTQGFYSLSCPSCNFSLLRCLYCRFKLPNYRSKWRMVRHLRSCKNKPSEESASFDTEVNFDPENFSVETLPNTDCDDDEQISGDLLNEGMDKSPMSDPNIQNLIRDRPGVMRLIDNSIGNKYGDDLSDSDSDDEIVEELILHMRNEAEEPTYHDKECIGLTLGDFDYMEGVNNQVYFMQDHNVSHGGIRGLVSRANTRCNDTSHYATTNAASFLFNMTDCLIHQTSAGQERFLESHALHSRLHSTPPDCQVEIPMCMKSAQRICLHGQHAIFSNLPCERVFEIDEHACISLDAKIDMIFARGTKFSFFKDHQNNTNTQGFNGTIAGQELYHELLGSIPADVNESDTCFGHIMLWSDSFLRCFSRQKDNSIWLLVARVCPPESHSTSDRHTFCLAFGSSKLNHDKVIQYYLKEIKTMMRGKHRYYGRDDTKKKSTLRLALVYTQPTLLNVMLYSIGCT